MKHYLYLILCCLTPVLLDAQFSEPLALKKAISNTIWIQKVSIGNWNFTSGANDGYYFKEDSKLVLKPDSSYALQLELGGYPRVRDTMYWRVWIDLNKDNDFADEGEQMWAGKTLHRGIARGNFHLPSLEPGNYRLRVVVGKKPFSMPSGEDGQVIELEDYGFTVRSLSPCKLGPPEEYLQIVSSDYNATKIALKHNDQIRYDFSLTVNTYLPDFHRAYQDVQSDTLRIGELREGFIYELAPTLTCANGDTLKLNPIKLRVAYSIVANCDAQQKRRVWFYQLTSTVMSAQILEGEGHRMQGRYRKKGANQWSTRIKTGRFYLAFDSLETNQDYEFQVRISCTENPDWGEWSEVFLYRMENCRPPRPHELNMYTVVNNHPNVWVRAGAQGGMVANAINRWSFRELGTPQWSNDSVTKQLSHYFVNLTVGKTYEFRVQIGCSSGKSIAAIDTFTMPPFCDVIEPNAFFLYSLADTHAKIWMQTGRRKVGYEFLIRAKGSTDYRYIKYDEVLVSRLFDLLPIQGLQPNTTYELLARLICGQDSVGSTDWSAPFLFTTRDCVIPGEGEIALVEMKANQSAVLSADFINHLGGVNYDYHWKVKAANTSQWNSSSIKGTNRITFNNLLLNQTYDVQVVVKCPSRPQDSLKLTSKFIYTPEQCSQKPNLSYITTTLGKDSILKVKFSLPPNYKVQIRAREFYRDFYYYPVYTGEAEHSYKTLGRVYELQFRLICPNGNTGPWSDTIRIEPLKPFQGGESLALYDQEKMQHRTQIAIAPNPNSGQFSILFPEEMPPQPEAYLEVLNTAGQRIYSLKTAIDPTQNLPLDLRQQAPGLYILRIQAGQKVYTERLVIASNR